MYDMTIRLQTNGKKCLYEQIYEHIRQEIREGKLLAGERLPSTRSLAEFLQVARSTVEYAYDQLLSEGYIESRPYRGYFVCSLEELFQMEENQLRREADFWGEKKKKEEYLYDFSPNEIDMTHFPFGIWKKITKNILTDGNSELFSQGEPQGDYDLRLTISRYLHSSRGVNCTPEQIIVGAGNDYLLMLLEKILGRRIKIAMENPTYKRACQIFESFAYEIVTVDMDENGMKVSMLTEADVNAAYVMPSHQFPTGTVMPIGRRRELLKWADKGESRFLIEDDYDSEFRYKGKPIPSLQSSDEHGKVIYLGTFSKAIAPAIRVSYMVLPKKLLKKYKEQCYFYSCTVSRIDQRILNEFIRDGYFERHLNKMRKHYRSKHDVLLECLKPFEEEFEISGEHAGLHILLTTKKNAPEEYYIQSAAKRRVKVYGLSDSLVAKANSKATILLGFGGLKEDEIVQGVNLLKEAWINCPQ
ncbi:MAG: PLP-dependent aminotransferase family protein [Lachnospiraceae bacterium]|nr:PLP-dependent aminotransferase family protein [Lachnospiraceae bacterium]